MDEVHELQHFQCFRCRVIYFLGNSTTHKIVVSLSLCYDATVVVQCAMLSCCGAIFQENMRFFATNEARPGILATPDRSAMRKKNPSI